MFLKPQHTGFLLQKFIRIFLLTSILAILCGPAAFAGSEEPPEEIMLMLTVPRVGTTELPALIQGETPYLSITGLFNYLKIKNRITQDLDSVTGFFLTPTATYTISKVRNRVFYQDRNITLQPNSLLRTENDLYLRADYFGKIFDLNCEFDFRSLSITVKTTFELPVIREMQMEAIRKNIGRLKGEQKADTTIGQEYPLLRGAVADWQVNTAMVSGRPVQSQVTLGLGGMVLGGETNVNLFILPGKPFEERMQLYRWRYINNESPVVKQISVGKISPESISTLRTGLKGLQLTNAPVTYRKSFGTYTISNTTEPGWMVELYVNNILVNLTKADASGFYTFEVPLVYGQSNVRLRFYGPWGEEKTKDENIIIPFNFLPENQFEYSLTGGLVEQGKNDLFGRFSMKYGVNNAVTVGGGLEYFSAVTSGHYMPYASVSYRFMSNIVFYGEHTYGVRSKMLLNYRHPSNMQVNVNYIKYEPGQTAVQLLEERRVALSMPFRNNRLAGFARLTFTQQDEFKKRLSNTELLLSAFYSYFSGNFNTFAILSQKNLLIRSNLSLTARLPWRSRLTQQTQYEYAGRQFTMYRAELEKAVWKNGFLNISYERNIASKSNVFSIGLRFNFSGLQAAFFGIATQNSVGTFQSLKGSAFFDDKNGHFQFSNQGNMGRGGVSIVSFLDINGNSKRDAGEPKVCGLQVKMNGGRIARCNSDTTIQITGLEAYNNYLLEIDKNSFDNVAWQIKKPLVNVVASPNYFKVIEVPVAVLAEVEGRVVLESKDAVKGQGRMIVRFYKDGRPIARVMTEPDGYFNYLGFIPGEYTAEIDTEQLKKVGFRAAPEKLPFTIHANTEGDVLKGLDFVLTKTGE